MGPIGWPELLIILVVVLLLFGTTRLAGLGKASGKAIREFKEETRDLSKDGTPAGPVAGEQPAPGNQQAPAGQPAQPAPQQIPPVQQPYLQQGTPGQQPQYPAQQHPTGPQQSGEVYEAEIIDPERPTNQ